MLTCVHFDRVVFSGGGQDDSVLYPSFVLLYI